MPFRVLALWESTLKGINTLKGIKVGVRGTVMAIRCFMIGAANRHDRYVAIFLIRDTR
jgi:hypothetical protein